MACGTPVAAYPVPGPIDIVDEGVTRSLDNNLTLAIARCLVLNRDQVEYSSLKWTWAECWHIFQKNLVSVV